MIADTVNNKIATITTIQPINATGRLKMFRSGSRSMNGSAASRAMNAPGRAMAPRNWPNSPAKIFSRRSWNKKRKYHSGSGW